MSQFLTKINQRIDTSQSLLCVGLDSDWNKIPDQFKNKKYPQFEFNQWIIEQTHPYVLAYKPNSAFYEARGADGMHELKLTFELIRKKYPEIITILDAKRADIGSTNQGYVNWAFDWLGADAITLHPYLGQEALQPFLDRKNKGCIILCKTSNPGGGEIQDVEMQMDSEVVKGKVIIRKKLWQFVAEKVAREWNKNRNCALVVGATYPDELSSVREIVGEMPILIPGIGAQGGDLETTVKAGKDKNSRGMIINAGRTILFSQEPVTEAKKLYQDINKFR